MSQERDNWRARLKKKWGINSEFQFWMIMLIFSLAGSSCVFVRKPIFEMLKITSETNPIVWFCAWLVVIFPAYQILLMFWGTVLGQFQFVWWFEKKMLRRMGLYRGPETPPPGADEIADA